MYVGYQSDHQHANTFMKLITMAKLPGKKTFAMFLESQGGMMLTMMTNTITIRCSGNIIWPISTTILVIRACLRLNITLSDLC